MVYVAFSPTFQTAVAKNPAPGIYKGVAIAMAGFMAAMVAWGIMTAVGLIKLRGWARISILVFAGLLTGMSVIMGLTTLALQPPASPGVPVNAMRTMRYVMAAVYAVPLLIGIWWLVQFSHRDTRAAFLAADPSSADGARPLSLSIIGWIMVVGGIGSLLPAVMGFPGFVLGGVFTGWSARIWYACLGLAELYGGSELLHLRERGRLLAIVVCGLMFANAVAMSAVPHSYERALAAQRAQWPAISGGLGATNPLPGREALLIGVCLAGVALVPLWFLYRHRTAFKPADA